VVRFAEMFAQTVTENWNNVIALNGETDDSRKVRFAHVRETSIELRELSPILRESVIMPTSSATIICIIPSGYQCSFGSPLWNCAILTPNSQICVALMVSAPTYVAQKEMSYLRDPQEQNRGLWVGY